MLGAVQTVSQDRLKELEKNIHGLGWSKRGD